jgi:NADH-quinone oxidoreductase subunit L
VSQLGYMFLACGVGAFGVAVFHLFTHAFFKALLFLGSGSVIHAMSGEQDMRKMGGLRHKIPWTYWTFVVGTLAIAGVPFLAGFYSKDEILAAVMHSGNTWLFAVGLVTAGLTAFYMTRQLVMTFWGHFRGDHEAEHHVHESPWTMLGPLVILAVGCFVVGRIGIPHFVATVFRVEGAEADKLEWWIALLPLVGMLVAGYLYTLYKDVPGKIAAAAGPLYRALLAKWGFDLLYDWIAARLVVDGSSSVLWKGVDAGAIDGAVNGTAGLMAGLARSMRVAQTGLVRGYALVMFGGAVLLLAYILLK